MENKAFMLDPHDWGGLLDIMEEYGDIDQPFFGKDEDLQDVEISVYKDQIIKVTYQNNGWVRKDIYWRDGTVEELFGGKWE